MQTLEVCACPFWHGLNEVCNHDLSGCCTDCPDPLSMEIDYTGDGNADYIVHSDGTWTLNGVDHPHTEPVPGSVCDGCPECPECPAVTEIAVDYNGDGVTDYLFRNNGTWRDNSGVNHPYTEPVPGADCGGTPGLDYIDVDQNGDGVTDWRQYRDGSYVQGGQRYPVANFPNPTF